MRGAQGMICLYKFQIKLNIITVELYDAFYTELSLSIKPRKWSQSDQSLRLFEHVIRVFAFMFVCQTGSIKQSKLVIVCVKCIFSDIRKRIFGTVKHEINIEFTVEIQYGVNGCWKFSSTFFSKFRTSIVMKCQDNQFC